MVSPKTCFSPRNEFSQNKTHLYQKANFHQKKFSPKTCFHKLKQKSEKQNIKVKEISQNMKFQNRVNITIDKNHCNK